MTLYCKPQTTRQRGRGKLDNNRKFSLSKVPGNVTDSFLFLQRQNNRLMFRHKGQSSQVEIGTFQATCLEKDF